MECLVKTDDRAEVDKITSFIRSLPESDKKAMLMFIQGFQFANSDKAS